MAGIVNVLRKGWSIFYGKKGEFFMEGNVNYSADVAGEDGSSDGIVEGGSSDKVSEGGSSV